ncbi:MAG: VTT domain-containing protein [Eubacteriales bacterium]
MKDRKAADMELDISQRHRKIAGAVSIFVFILFSIAVFYFIGRPMLTFVSEPEKFRLWVYEKGFLGKLAFVGMMALQVVIAIIPGEPLEIGAGYAFGIWEGTLLSLLGQVIGSIVVFLFVKYIGIRAVEAFFPKEKIQSLKFLKHHKQLNLLVFILFFIPGTPKDILTYFVGLTPMNLMTFLVITFFARIPSVITSTIGGDAIGLQNYQFAIVVFAITLLISLIGILVYRKITKRHEK